MSTDYLSVDEIKRIELEILKYIHSFCECNNIKYTLIGGTLLGAVRHKGFIPWDDDIDICMPRESYVRFKELFNTYATEYHYKLIDSTNTDNYPYAFAKVIDTKTKIHEYRFKPYDGGIYVDVFPIDDVGNDMDAIIRVNGRLKKYRKLLIFKTACISYYHGLKKAGLILAKIATSFCGRKTLINRVNNMSMLLQEEKSKYCACMIMLTYGIREVFEAAWFQQCVKLKFEDSEFYAPADYKKVLSSMYNDYMKLPSEDKRVRHHSFDAWYV